MTHNFNFAVHSLTFFFVGSSCSNCIILYYVYLLFYFMPRSVSSLFLVNLLYQLVISRGDNNLKRMMISQLEWVAHFGLSKILSKGAWVGGLEALPLGCLWR